MAEQSLSRVGSRKCQDRMRDGIGLCARFSLPKARQRVGKPGASGTEHLRREADEMAAPKDPPEKEGGGNGTERFI